VQVLDGKPQYVELAGNLVPVSKSGDQPSLVFRAFRENRAPLLVRVRDATHDAAGRLAFVPESRRPPTSSDLVVSPICTLNITLPDYVPGASSHLDDDELAEVHTAAGAARTGAPALILTRCSSRVEMYQSMFRTVGGCLLLLLPIIFSLLKYLFS